MIKIIHPVAGALAILTIATFWLSTALSELFASQAVVVAVKTAIPWGFVLLIPALAAAGGSGFALAKGGRAGLIGAKLKRMPLIAANGVLVLIPSALFLASKARADEFDAGFCAVQALELRSRKERRSGPSAPMPRTRRPTSMRPISRPTARGSAAIFLQSDEGAEALQTAAPDFANAFYFHAQALGRYSQEISIAEALAQGIGRRVKASLDKAVKLEPNHAEAHIALGAYHAEIVNKVGAMLASLTYGASKDEAVKFKHIALARKLPPDSAIARIEQANGLVMLFGKAKLAKAEKLYAEAAKCAPGDAMQKLDAGHAREEAEG